MMIFRDLEFASPEMFWLLTLLPVMVIWYWFKLEMSKPKVILSASSSLSKFGNSYKNFLKHGFFALKIIALAALITSLARPQSSSSWQNVTTEGIDIVISLDISGSMLAEDLKPNRLEASKNVAINFIESRPNDRIGLVIYSGESFTQCPLTTDHTVLKNLFRDVKNGMIEDGTAIGNGLATAVTRLKDSDAKSRVAILLTDGENNMGNIPPLTASEIASTFGIRVYTIGVGTIGSAPFPFRNPFGGITYQNVEVTIDEDLLKQIANQTGGKYFRATDNQTLENIYAEIDQLERSKVEVTEFKRKNDEYEFFLIVALALLSIDFLGKIFILRGIV